MQSDLLATPVRRLAQVGPKYEQLLAKLAIKTVGDLVYHIPFRYNDYSHKVLVQDTLVNQSVSVTGVMGRVTNLTTSTGKKVTIANLTDSTGSLALLWFNQHYLKKTLQETKTYTVSGKITLYKNKKCLFSPQLEPGEGGKSTARLVGIYPETAGISSSWLRSRNNDILKRISADTVKDVLPQALVAHYGFPELSASLHHVHFPQTLAQASKARERLAFEEVFVELLKVEKRKQDWTKNLTGCQLLYEPHKTSIEGLVRSLPFKLTPSQRQALDAIIADLQAPTPMNRLLEGDVGSGKTVVSLIVAYLCYLNGYKTLLMAPTELLAAQHFATFTQLLTRNFDARPKLSLQTASTSTKATQEFDIAIGTHALLYAKTRLAQVGLVIIDEQHRFGVEQRGQLITDTADQLIPNLLAMTATPIPRTLALTVYGDLAISVVQPHTPKGRNIQTRVAGDQERDKLYQWIKAQNQPTFIVCPFIDQSTHEDFDHIKAAHQEFKNLQRILPTEQMLLMHGKMKPKEKEAAMEAFKTGKVRFLVSTPVIEVGIDVPEAAIIVVESAERYGLASLHQLRGRVGRLGQQGHCLLLYTGNSHAARQRLKYMETIDNGMELAELDLKLRGQGDIFGTMQSGINTFKLASVYDTELLEVASKEARKYFAELAKYPLLLEKITQQGMYVGQN
jgi:ATP-dependent DNA helicase RecG